MEEERTRAMTQEEMKEEEEGQAQIRLLKKTIIMGVLLSVTLLFLIFTYNEWIHPYPNKYRVITNGYVYKIQKKNWFCFCGSQRLFVQKPTISVTMIIFLEFTPGQILLWTTESILNFFGRSGLP